MAWNNSAISDKTDSSGNSLIDVRLLRTQNLIYISKQMQSIPKTAIKINIFNRQSDLSELHLS